MGVNIDGWEEGIFILLIICGGDLKVIEYIFFVVSV